jgi:hypothetical protein
MKLASQLDTKGILQIQFLSYYTSVILNPAVGGKTSIPQKIVLIIFIYLSWIISCYVNSGNPMTTFLQ